MGGGAGWIDFDNDGFLDAYLVQSGNLQDVGKGDRSDRAQQNRLFRNDQRGGFVDVTERAGVGGAAYGMGCAVGDYNGDGRMDLYVVNIGRNHLFRNDGDGKFTDVAREAGVEAEGWSSGAAFVDYDRDGDQDLFVIRYVDWRDEPAFTRKMCYADSGARDYCSPQAYNAPSVDLLFRNDGDGTFSDVTQAAGLSARAGTGLGVLCSDFDNDGDIDLYVSNDQMPSFFWRNSGDGTFVECGMELGCAVDELGRSQAGMGVDADDLDDDGDLDVWKVHLHRETHVLYRNLGRYFEDATLAHGLAAATRRYTGFGTAFADFDHDGLLDIFVANGRVQFVNEPYPTPDIYAEPNQLIRQVRPGWFEDVTEAAGAGLRLIDNSRAAAFGDYDNDGDVDVLIANRDGPARLLRNDCKKAGSSVTLHLIDRRGCVALGARLFCTMGEKTRLYEAVSAYSYAAANDPRVHIGLGAATSLSTVRIVWPDGAESRHGPFAAGQVHLVRQPNR